MDLSATEARFVRLLRRAEPETVRDVGVLLSKYDAAEAEGRLMTISGADEIRLMALFRRVSVDERHVVLDVVSSTVDVLTRNAGLPETGDVIDFCARKRAKNR